jgi:hypothetical protein
MNDSSSGGNGRRTTPDPLADYRLTPEQQVAQPKAAEHVAGAPQRLSAREELQREIARTRMVGLNNPQQPSATPQPPSDVWPPSPYSYVPQPAMDEMTAATIGSYRSPIPLSRVLTGLLASTVVLDAVLFVASVTAASQLLSVLLVILIAVLFLVTLVPFYMWTYRLYSNLKSFNTNGLSTTPGWSVGFFFMPVLGIYKPHEIFQEIWRASGVGRLNLLDPWAWKSGSGSPMITLWWASVIATDVAMRIASYSIFANGWLVAVSLVSAANALLEMSLVTTLSQRQEEKLASMLQPNDSVPFYQ